MMLSRLASSLGLDTTTTILGCIILVVLWKLFSKNKTVELLSQIPGPRPLPVVGNLSDALIPRLDVFKETIKRSKKYGSLYVMWFGGDALVWLLEPAYFQEVLHRSTHLNKGIGYEFAARFVGNGLITADSKTWVKNRKIITPTFHFHVLDSFFHIFRKNVKTLTTLLDKKAETGEIFDIYNYVNNYALDNVCEAAMEAKGESLIEERSKYARTAMRLSELITYRINKIWLCFDFIYNNTSHGKEFDRLLRSTYDFVDKIIRERKEVLKEKKPLGDEVSTEVDEFGVKKRAAFLDVLLETTEKDNTSLSLQEIRDEVNTFLFAGHDTTSTSTAWTIFLIGHHPKIQEDLYREQREVFGDDMERPITQEDLPKMELLDRVIKESLRLYPSVPLIGRKLDSDVKFGKYTVPKGTTVVLDIFNMHRNPSVYEEPDKFDPDRFLPENSTKRHSYSYVPFSAGPRNCVGRRFALMLEKLTIASLVRRYEIKSIEKPEEMKLLAELVLRSYNGIKVTLKKRVHD